jgi:NADH:ubiquinone oxidoreductase subunit 6 (subunit J)
MSTMNAAAFYILAVVILAGAAAAVVLPTPRDAALGLFIFTTAVGLMAIASGAYFTGAIEVVLSALAIAGMALALRRSGQLDWRRRRPQWSARSIIAAAAGTVAVLGVLLFAFSANASGWHSGSGGAALVTLLHYRAPYALVAGVLALAVGTTGALLVGRRSRDEVEFDRTVEARTLRDERTRRRRADREAARRSRRSRQGEGVA